MTSAAPVVLGAAEVLFFCDASEKSTRAARLVKFAAVMRPLPIRLSLMAGALTMCVVLSEPPARPLTRAMTGVVAFNPQLLRVLWAGFHALAADFYWVRTCEQMGMASKAEEYRDVGVWANLATDLDPKFKLVYGFAAVAMPFNLGRNNWVNGDESTALLRKGLVQYPNEFWFEFLLAHNLIFYQKDFAAAGELLRTLAGRPNAPRFLRHLATRVLAQGGEVEAALEFAHAGLAAAEDDDSRATFAFRIKQLETERVLQSVDRAIAQFRETEQRLPSGIVELLTRGFLTEMPVDPSGGELYVDRKGRARSTFEGRRLEVITSEQKQLDAEEEKKNGAEP